MTDTTPHPGVDDDGSGINTPQPPGPRAHLDERHRQALRSILQKGGLAALGTESARLVWNDGIGELVALAGWHFTAEELDVIEEGTL